MINFRFHLVSLIAVFLALALGIVVGSTVIDRAIVDGLEAQIERVERNAEAQRRENDELRSEFEELQAFADQAAPFALEGGRLLDVPVAVFATRGIDEDAARALLEAARQAGAVAPAIFWLEPSWAVKDRGQRDALRELLGLPRAAADELRVTALRQLAARVSAGAFVPDPAADAADVLASLTDQGFLQVDQAGAPDFDLATFPGAGARVILISGAEADTTDAVFVPLVRSVADVSLLTLAVEVPPRGDDAGAPSDIVGAIRSDTDLADRVSTADSVGGITGRVTVVLALEELGRGKHGHYGLGQGASRRLPEPAGA